MMDAFGIAGAVLMIYGLVIVLMGIAQAADLTGGQVIGVLIVMLIIFGGVGYAIFYFSQPKWEEFAAEVQRIGPSYYMPGAA